jgi:hypothetical protein
MLLARRIDPTFGAPMRNVTILFRLRYASRRIAMRGSLR